MKYLVFCYYFVVSATFAASSVDFVEVQNDVVIFSTAGQKNHSSPDCLNPASQNLWSVSLSTDSLVDMCFINYNGIVSL